MRRPVITALATPARWVREVIVTPGATVVLAVLLLVDAGIVSDRSELQRLLFAQRARSWHFRPSWQGVALRQQAWPVSYRVLERSSSELTETWDDSAVWVAFWRTRLTGGAWATTWETNRTFLTLSNADGLVEGPETIALRMIIAEDVLLSLGEISAADASALAQADITHRRILWSGVAHNTVTAALLAGFLASLAWVRHSPAWITAFRHNRAWKRGRCGRCGYPSAGLPGPRCPECGDALGP